MTKVWHIYETCNIMTECKNEKKTIFIYDFYKVILLALVIKEDYSKLK